ncbi:MAG: Fe-S cluster assembly protein HesB [Nanoarchaeota archaeon]
MVNERKVREFQKKILTYYQKNGRNLPWRKTSDRYAILISEVMLQQTQVDRVIPKYLAWLEVFPTVEALAGASLADVLRMWSGLGYNGRGKRLHELAKIVVEKHGGIIPDDPETLQELPGIGPYTARSVLIFSDNMNLAAVDTNIRRILIHEFNLSENTSSEALQKLADACVPISLSRDWHNALMDYGAMHLTARKTGIRPTSRQSKFEGSNRWYRGRILAKITAEGMVCEKDILDEYGKGKNALEELENEGFVEKRKQKGKVQYALRS